MGLPVPAKPHFLKLFRKLINGSRPPEEIYLVHDASHVLTGTTFTHAEPPLVLLAGEAAEQGLYFASRGVPRAVGWILFYGGAFVECARRIASFRQVGRGIQAGIFNRAYDHARRTRLSNLFEIPVKELWSVSVAEARRRLGMPEQGVAAEVYRGITLAPGMASALRQEWRGFWNRAVTEFHLPAWKSLPAHIVNQFRRAPLLARRPGRRGAFRGARANPGARALRRHDG